MYESDGYQTWIEWWAMQAWIFVSVAHHNRPRRLTVQVWLGTECARHCHVVGITESNTNLESNDEDLRRSVWIVSRHLGCVGDTGQGRLRGALLLLEQ